LKYNRYPKRDAIKNYFPLPNEVFMLGLETGELAVYSYLLYREDRKTYQCHPSYKTIGRAIGKSENSVRKYVAALEDKGLIRTEPTSIFTKTGRKQNGSLLYNIRPIQEAIDIFNARQLYRLEAETARQRTAKKLAKLASVGPCEPLCAPLETEPSPSPTEGSLDEIEPLSEDLRGAKEKAG
jgi:predicted transcriptional regulator